MARRELGTPRWDDMRKVWVLQVSVNGKRRSFYSGNPSLRKGPAECRAKALDWVNASTIDYTARFEDVWNEFLNKYYAEKYKPTSVNAIASRAKAHLLPMLGRKRMQDISRRDWQAIIDRAYKDKAKSRKTLQGIATTITTFCKWAAARGYMQDSDVPLYFDLPVGATKKQKQILQPDQLRLLFSPAADDGNFYLYCFRFLVLTGLRRGEFCALQTERDFDGESITVRESISHEGIVTEGKTDKAQRTIRLSHLALEQLSMHRLRAKSQTYLFSSPDGRRISPRVLRNHWQAWREAHGIDLTLHELRHTFVSYSRLRTNNSLDDLKELYGHSSAMDTDKTYVHDILLTPAEIREREEKAKKLSTEIGEVFKVIIDNGDGENTDICL